MNNQWRGCATEGTERVTHGNIEIFAGFADGRGFSDHPAPGFLRTGPRFPGCLPGKSRSGLWISGFEPCAATRAHASTGDRLEQERIMLKLHFNPGSCSLASHAALDEAGLPYETELVDLTQNVQFSEEYRKKNPWARVPALQIDDQILTENIAILSYIAGLVPQKQLLPDTGLARARALEWLALLSSTVHVAFRPIFRPNRLAESAQAQQDVAATGLIALRNVLALLDERLGEGPYTLGNQFSLCDLYLFVFVLWSRRPVLDGKLGTLSHLDAFGERLSARPAVRAALAREGGRQRGGEGKGGVVSVST